MVFLVDLGPSIDLDMTMDSLNVVETYWIWWSLLDLVQAADERNFLEVVEIETWWILQEDYHRGERQRDKGG
jgi:hypothetical protein